MLLLAAGSTSAYTDYFVNYSNDPYTIKTYCIGGRQYSNWIPEAKSGKPGRFYVDRAGYILSKYEFRNENTGEKKEVDPSGGASKEVVIKKDGTIEIGKPM
jgi:hypothetical protein